MPDAALNTVYVDSPVGSRRFDLFSGDVMDASCDVLAFSTHANANLVPSGLVLDAIRERYGADLVALEPLLTASGTAGTYRAHWSSRLPYDEVLVVRVPGARSIEESGGTPLEVYRRVVWSLFGSIAALELGGAQHRRLALPLLGGQRAFDVPGALGILLEQASRWLERSRSMEQVALHVVEGGVAAEWDGAMNSVLGRKPIDESRAEVNAALAGEIVAQARALRESDSVRRRAYEGIIAALERRPMYLQQVAAAGRLAAEHVVRGLRVDAALTKEQTLFDGLAELRQLGRIAPWVTNYLDALRVFGNEELHARSGVKYRPASLADGDLVAILGALQRVLAFWSEYRESSQTDG